MTFSENMRQQEPPELQHCIDGLERGDEHLTCCCETEQRCRVAVRYAIHRKIAAGIIPSGVLAWLKRQDERG